jgi:dihydroneopterin aldolase
LKPSVRDIPSEAMPSGSPIQASKMDLIFIDGLEGQTIIGIHDSELHVPQTIRIDLQAGVIRSRACGTDWIGDTIDYGLVRGRLLRLLSEHRLQLLESFAESIAGILVHEFGAAWVRVKVTKPRKFDDVDAVGVQIERTPQDLQSSTSVPEPSTARNAAVLHLLASGMVPAAQR